MWCFQKPGFEALLLTELQKQQQCNQFCDTLLKAEGVSVPAHSCVLSAISPNMSSALSSSPAPPAGQSRLLEFQALGACTLLHMVRLLYSGEMAGDGEKEKQEAILAAAKLGIHGLVEVTKRGRKSRNEEGGGQHTEVGVQTEPPMPEESEKRWGRWRREVRDGSTILWKEIPSDGEKDICTQTEELQVNTAPTTHATASLETIDATALQGLGQTDSHLVPPQIPYVPISLIYPPDSSSTHYSSSALGDSNQDSAAAGHTSFAVDPQSWWAGSQVAGRDVVAGEELEDERLEQFQGNIPGFINYFLNPDKEGSRRGRAGRRRGAGVGRARRAGTGERRAKRPQARTGGRGRGGLTQTVDVQNVGVSKLQKLFLQRGGMRASRPGQGGGAVGRKLYLKTRELLKPAKICQRRRRRGKVWEFSQSGEVLPFSEGGGGNKQCGGKNTTQHFNQDIPPVGRAQRLRAKPTSFSLSSPPMRFYNVQTLPASSPSLQPSPCPSLSAASYVSPASSLLHTTSLPPPAPPLHEDQPEHIDRLLEEVMMGLDILPNNNTALHSQPPLPDSSSSCMFVSSGNKLTQNKQQDQTTGLLEESPDFHGSTQVDAVARGHSSSSSANSEMPILQHHREGELNEILDHFLQSFKQHVDNCTAREEMGGESSTKASQPYTVLSKYRKTRTETITTNTPRLQNTRRPQPARRSQTTVLQQSDKAQSQLNRSQRHKQAAALHSVPPKHTERTSGKARAPTKRQKKRRKNQYMFSLERKKKPVSSTNPKPRIPPDRGDKQLQRMPVVKLERAGQLPVRVTLQGGCQSQEAKSLAKTKTGSSSVKYSHGNLSDKNQPKWWSTKMYPIRSWLREANIVDSFCEEPFPHELPPGCRRCRPKKNRQLSSLCDGESSTRQILPVEQLQKNHERREEESTLQPQEETEGCQRRGRKRGAESEEETRVKRVCFEQMTQLTTETSVPSSESANGASEAATVEIEDVIDVETVSLTSIGDSSQREEKDKKTVWSEITFRETAENLVDEEMESSSDEIIDVDGDSDGITDVEKDRHNSRERAVKGCCQSRTAPALSHFVSPPSCSAKGVSLGSTGSWEDEDIDVIGGSSPLPDPVIISWRESSEGEEEEGDEDIDVV